MKRAENLDGVDFGDGEQVLGREGKGAESDMRYATGQMSVNPDKLDALLENNGPKSTEVHEEQFNAAFGKAAEGGVDDLTGEIGSIESYARGPEVKIGTELPTGDLGIEDLFTENESKLQVLGSRLKLLTGAMLDAKSDAERSVITAQIEKTNLEIDKINNPERYKLAA